MWTRIVYNTAVSMSSKRIVDAYRRWYGGAIGVLIAILGGIAFTLYKNKKTPQPKVEPTPRWISWLQGVAALIASFSMFAPIVLSMAPSGWILNLMRGALADLGRASALFNRAAAAAEETNPDDAKEKVKELLLAVKVVNVMRMYPRAHADITEWDKVKSRSTRYIKPRENVGDCVDHPIASVISSLGDVQIEDVEAVCLWVEIDGRPRRVTYVRKSEIEKFEHVMFVERQMSEDSDQNMQLFMSSTGAPFERITVVSPVEFKEYTGNQAGEHVERLQAVASQFRDTKYYRGVGYVVATSVILGLLMYMWSKPRKTEARAFFRQIPATLATQACVPVYSATSTAPTGMCDVLVKYSFPTGTYWGLTQHVFDEGFDPYVNLTEGRVTKKIFLKPLVQFVGHDQAYIPANKIPIPGIWSLS